MKKILLSVLFAVPFALFGQGLGDRLSDLLDPTPSFEGMDFSAKELGEYRDLYRKHKGDIDKIFRDKSTSRREKASKMRELKREGQSGTTRQASKAKGKVKKNPGTAGAPGNGQARAPERGSTDPRPTTTRTSTPKPRSKAGQLPRSGGTGNEVRTPQSQESRPTGTRSTGSRPQSKVRRLG